MRVNDLFLAIMVLIGAAALAVAASALPPIPGQNYGAEVFPLAVAGGLFLCGLLLGAQALRAGAGPVFALGWAREKAALARAAAPIAAVLAYVVLAPRIGFIPAATLLLLPLLLMLKTRAVVAFPVAIATALVTYYAFSHGLRVPLPRGVIEALL
ncbi:MAG: hypothetical protein B7Y84_05675 [Azorhizobium sp. 32-67-21]|nr:MAG: hypothetical protein B7Y84_05675 [Azorhizobium sp. 32-67-21]